MSNRGRGEAAVIIEIWVTLWIHRSSPPRSELSPSVEKMAAPAPPIAELHPNAVVLDSPAITMLFTIIRDKRTTQKGVRASRAPCAWRAIIQVC